MKKKVLQISPLREMGHLNLGNPGMIQFWILKYHNEDSNIYISHYMQDQMSGI